MTRWDFLGIWLKWTVGEETSWITQITFWKKAEAYNSCPCKTACQGVMLSHPWDAHPPYSSCLSGTEFSYWKVSLEKRLDDLGSGKSKDKEGMNGKGGELVPGTSIVPRHDLNLFRPTLRGNYLGHLFRILNPQLLSFASNLEGKRLLNFSEDTQMKGHFFISEEEQMAR